MAQSRASSRWGNDDGWDQSRDWGFDDRSLRPRSYPRSVPSEARTASAHPAPRRRAVSPSDAYAGEAAAPRRSDPSPPPAPGQRRTIVITGRGSERHHPATGRRPPQRTRERVGFNPDRIAMWAVLLGIVLLLVAATSSHAAVLPAHHVLTALTPAR